MPGLVLYKTDDVTAASGLTFGTVASGAESSAITVHLWNEAASELADISLVLLIDDGTGTYKVAGLPPLDQHWVVARVVGGNNATNDSTMDLNTSDWIGLGTNSRLRMKNIPAGCARYIELKLRAPNVPGQVTTIKNFQIVPYWSETSFGVAGGLAETGQGILSGIGDLTANEFVDAPVLAQSTVADDYVNVVPTTGDTDYIYNLKGVQYRRQSDAHQLNQNDSAAAALASGEAYWVTISVSSGATPTYTKGLKAVAASAVKPSAPAGELVIGWCKVRYNAVLTNIVTSDLTTVALHGQFRADVGTGLSPKVYTGRALIAGALVARTSTQSPLCTASSTNRLWLLASGGIIVTTTATPPNDGAMLIWTATTDGSSVTALVDNRVVLRPNPVFDTVLTSVAPSGTPRVLRAWESGSTWTNEAATAKAYFTLPTAVAGLRFTFICQDADGFRVVAGSGDTIRMAATVSGAAGYTETTTRGDWVTLTAINSVEWVGQYQGTFTTV